MAQGFSTAAFDFYDDLEIENTRAFWEKNRHVYESEVRLPMGVLLAELAEEFGDAKVFRPNRDVRFAQDKSPYKTHQGGYVPISEATGFYVEVSAAGVLVAGGFYAASPERLARFRQAVAGPRGPELEGLIAHLGAEGFERDGDTLKTAPRGYAKVHPRIELLRHRTLSVRKGYGFEPFVSTPELTEHVRHDWRRMRPVIEWCARAMDGEAV